MQGTLSSQLATDDATWTCPSWCSREHLPGWRSHHAVVWSHSNEFIDEHVNVELSWYADATHLPKVSVATDAEHESVVAELSPEEARHLAHVMRATGAAGALADALVSAADMIGSER